MDGVVLNEVGWWKGAEGENTWRRSELEGVGRVGGGG